MTQPQLCVKDGKGTDYTEQVTEQVTEQAEGVSCAMDDKVIRLVKALGNNTLSVKELMASLGLNHRPHFITAYLSHAISYGVVCLLHKNSPRHPNQKYLLTIKGVQLYNKLNNR